MTVPLLLNLGCDPCYFFRSMNRHYHKVVFLTGKSAKDQITQTSRRLRTVISTDGNIPTPQINGRLISGALASAVPPTPNTVADPYPGAIWNYRCTGIFTSWWTRSPMLARLVPASFLPFGRDTAARFICYTLYPHWHSATILAYPHWSPY